MKVCLIGYGKMGRAIERVLTARHHEVCGRVSSNNRDQLPACLAEADIAIEFTRPDSAVEHLGACLRAGVPVVCGTTGWLDRYGEIQQLTDRLGGALLYSSNFSVGVQLFFALNRKLAQAMSAHGNYQAEVRETHHIHKRDAPSGTALQLTADILAIHPSYHKWSDETSPEAGTLPVISSREGEIVGFHAVRYHSITDEIEIRHNAHSREGFANGAVLACEYLLNKKGIYTMKDVLQLNDW